MSEIRVDKDGRREGKTEREREEVIRSFWCIERGSRSRQEDEGCNDVHEDCITKQGIN